MPVFYFTIGFMTSFLIIIILIAIIYYYLSKKRERSVKIQGYLDLIPDLNETQRRQVREIREVFLPKVAEIRKDLYLKRSELADLLFEEPIDPENIDELARNILESQAKLENEVIEHILEEKEILSPLQKRRFYEIIVEQFSSGGLGVHDVKGRKT
jgi:hypothetical protein